MSDSGKSTPEDKGRKGWVQDGYPPPAVPPRKLVKAKPASPPPKDNGKKK